MKKRTPTTCPVVFSLDIFGDTWSLVILRDILFNGKRHFREFLSSDEEAVAIASNILSNRLELFVQNGLVTKRVDPRNKSAAIYAPTKKALDLLPMLIEMMHWGIKYNPNTDLSAPFVPQIEDDPEGLRSRILEKFAVET